MLKLRRGQIWRHQVTCGEYLIEAIADHIDRRDQPANGYKSIKVHHLEEDQRKRAHLVYDIDTQGFSYIASDYGLPWQNEDKVRRVFYREVASPQAISWARPETSFLGKSDGKARFVLVSDVEDPCIKVWAFGDAPKEYQNLSTYGGDERWVIRSATGERLDSTALGTVIDKLSSYGGHERIEIESGVVWILGD